MWPNIKKAIVIAIAIVAVMWAWNYLKKDNSTKQLLEKLKKLTNEN